jgi:hypothetical protein
MVSINMTKSELLFEELCNKHRIPYDRLPVQQDHPQPDYELDLNGQRVVVEVKQIEPNEEDRCYAEAQERDGKASQCRNPDMMARRIRNHIKASRVQIKSYLQRHPATPAILVLFDNAKNQYTDPYTIQTAMFGWEQVTFSVYRDGKDPSVVDRGFGPRNNEEIRPDKNQQLSALTTLHEAWDLETRERFLALRFYHNQFAETAFIPNWWYGDHIVHFALADKVPREFQNWVRLTP